MKKIFSLIIASLLFTATAWAQDRLPAAGDYSIGFNAAPALNYIGNLFSDGNSVEMDWQRENTLVGTYMKSDDLAYRAGIGIGMASSKPNDTSTISASNISLMAGMMKLRRGNRIMGYYGAEAGLGISSDKTEVGSTKTEESGTEIMARGFVGAQYFIWPKVSIGAEYGLGLMLGSTKMGDAKSSHTIIGNDNAGGQIVLSVYF
ncbi:MAG: hypothetical protein FJ344_02980 [Sphingomonadales bacterium]|nr:hypothetical protein [Sphingomonadales bacterium]